MRAHELAITHVDLRMSVGPHDVARLQGRHIPEIRPFETGRLQHRIHAVSVERARTHVESRMAQRRPHERRAVVIRVAPAVRLRIPMLIVLRDRHRPIHPRRGTRHATRPQAVIRLQDRDHQDHQAQQHDHDREQRGRDRHAGHHERLARRPPLPLATSHASLPTHDTQSSHPRRRNTGSRRYRAKEDNEPHRIGWRRRRKNGTKKNEEREQSEKPEKAIGHAVENEGPGRGR